MVFLSCQCLSFRRNPTPANTPQAPKINSACFGTTFSSRKLPASEWRSSIPEWPIPHMLQTTFLQVLLLINPKKSSWRVEIVDQGQQRACPGLAQHWNSPERLWCSILGDAQIPSGHSPGQPPLTGLDWKVSGGLLQLQPFFNTLQRYFSPIKPKTCGEGGEELISFWLIYFSKWKPLLNTFPIPDIRA